ncbi:hypothetical protein ABT112_27370 [Streptomyces sp. NPDC002055]|uniref:hypothetical protein n=1 Tax=Streptomyces sp. NPDC002055 TaxID=3154534 RepID=UPI00331BE167
MPEHALRPFAQRTPNLDTVRISRIYWDGSSLVFRTPEGNEKRYPAGGAGISRAVHIELPGEDAFKRLRPAGDWGVVEFQNAEGARLFRLPLMEWLPEAPMPGSRPNKGGDLLELTGLSALLKEAGIPLRTVTDLDDPVLSNSVRGPDTDAYIGRTLPVWHSVLRGAALAIWFAFIICAMVWKDSAPWLSTVAATAFVLPPLSELGLQWAARRRERITFPAAVAMLRPSPASGIGATQRFCTTSAIRIQASDIVIVNSLGQERWLPRAGSHAPTRLVRIVSRERRTPIGVELRTKAGRVRAALPWAPWFGGPEGELRWTEFSSAVGVPTEDCVEPKKSVGWPRRYTMAFADVEHFGPLDAKTARANSDFVRTVLEDASPLPISLFGALTFLAGLLSVDASPVAGSLTMALAATAVGVYAGPGLAHQVNSRLRLDRPAPGQEATS